VAETDEVRALWSRVLDAAKDIIQQNRPAPETAHELERLYVDLVRLQRALEPFVALAAQWEHDTDRRTECEHEILVAAETLRRKFAP
jgi:hypothetical protein